MTTYCALAYLQIIPWGLLYEHRWGCISAANIIGLVASVVFFVRGDTKKKYKNKMTKGNKDTPPGTEGFGIGALKILDDFYLGLEDNPHWGVFDGKMFLYLIGGTVLNLNVLSFVAHQYEVMGGGMMIDYSSILYLFLFSFFVVEYLFHEHVHLYTWDFVGEKLGAKLIWGCLVFFPMFYPVGAWTIADHPIRHHHHLNDQHYLMHALAIITFFTGWILSRGANLQKYYFKIDPRSSFLGIQPRSIGGRILCSGYWGLSRHINYLGDLLMSVGLALAADYSDIIAWLYSIYYVVLFVPRERADDKRCHAKYGKDWEQYRRMVPARIVPYVY
eukprot:TRINITY_DN9397_c0_g1_i7.p1 TRINITY_DN9397_c0_g1~~TRINITY_DN9397_c0_g1_i7.p1  ORF type:complete len:387 (-),score=44.99 TRINITY_DN9397_c0_g1_i7:14-1006(-)